MPDYRDDLGCIAAPRRFVQARSIKNVRAVRLCGHPIRSSTFHLMIGDVREPVLRVVSPILCRLLPLRWHADSLH
jgi:hypothetical protein